MCLSTKPSELAFYPVPKLLSGVSADMSSGEQSILPRLETEHLNVGIFRIHCR